MLVTSNLANFVVSLTIWDNFIIDWLSPGKVTSSPNIFLVNINDSWIPTFTWFLGLDFNNREYDHFYMVSLIFQECTQFKNIACFKNDIFDTSFNRAIAA